MRRSKLLFGLLAGLLIMEACKKQDTPPNPAPVPQPPVVIQPPAPFGFYVVGYFPSYRNLSDVPDVKFKMCNVVNYAFFGVNANKELTVNNPTLVPQLVTKAKNNNAKVAVNLKN